MTFGLSIILMLVAFVVTMLVYPHVLNFARKHRIVDNPNARKLQRVPVPVMGGATVFVGFLVATVVMYCVVPHPKVIPIMGILFVMYLLGLWDDVKDVSPAVRFMVEMLVVWYMILSLHVEINDLHGLWGIHSIPDQVSVPLSILAGVGIMNALNLIDGVDGFCSTYGMMACIVFAIIFYYAGDMGMFSLALIGIGSLLPFFFHNVFGKTSKMFLGDGGSLMLGTLLAMFALRALTKDGPCALYSDQGISLPALVLAVLAVPVFDTLKVMTVRIANGYSPFHPDKTHLHHLFIDLDFSHLVTSVIIVNVNVFIVLALVLGWSLGLGVDGQMYLVVILSLASTWGFYFFAEWHHQQNDGQGTALWQRWCQHAKNTNLSGTPLWKGIRKAVDSPFLGGTSPDNPDTSGSPGTPGTPGTSSSPDTPGSPSTPANKIDPRIQ